MAPDERRGLHTPSFHPRRHFLRRRGQGGPAPRVKTRHDRGNLRCRMVAAVVQPHEKLIFEAAAQAEGLTLSSWARKQLLATVGLT